MHRKVLLGFLGHLLCRGLLELDGLLHGNLIRFNILMPDAARDLLDLGVLDHDDGPALDMPSNKSLLVDYFSLGNTRSNRTVNRLKTPSCSILLFFLGSAVCGLWKCWTCVQG